MPPRKRRFSRRGIIVGRQDREHFLRHYPEAKRVDAATHLAQKAAFAFLTQDARGGELNLEMVRVIFSQPIAREYLIHGDSKEAAAFLAILRVALRERREAPAATNRRLFQFLYTYRTVYAGLMGLKLPPTRE